jgi:hypothetical protein
VLAVLELCLSVQFLGYARQMSSNMGEVEITLGKSDINGIGKVIAPWECWVDEQEKMNEIYCRCIADLFPLWFDGPSVIVRV